MMFKVMSVKYISTMANSTLMGMEKAIITVGLTSRRNRASTRKQITDTTAMAIKTMFCRPSKDSLAF